MKIKPINGFVAIDPIAEGNRTEAGVFVPEGLPTKFRKGKVTAVGKGLYQHGEFTPMSVSVGDVVLYYFHAGFEFKSAGQKIVLVRESDIYAIVEEKGKQ